MDLPLNLVIQIKIKFLKLRMSLAVGEQKQSSMKRILVTALVLVEK
jgi:hypothetical protein